MAVNLPPIPNNPITDTFVWRDWFFKVSQLLVQQASIAWSSIDFTGSNLLDIQTRQHNALQSVQGGNAGQYYHLTQAEHTKVGTLTNVHNDLTGLQGGTTGEYYHLTAAQQGFINADPFIEAYDRTNTITLSTTPQLLKPTNTLNANNISYDASTGEFTFSYAGTYEVTVAVNALASAAGQQLYIWAENNTGSGWVVNTNSGKQYALINNDPTQCSVSVPTKRTAGQKVRYWISATSTNVSILTTTIPTTTAVVPTIRIQYAGV